MDFQVTIDAMAVCIQTRTPCLLTGAPGVAKTSITEGLMEVLCADHHTSIAALHEPPEYGGYPQPVAATETEPAGVALLACRWVNRLARVTDPSKIVGLFLDELSNAPPATRSAAMRGILDGVWGEVEIPRLAVVAAMNPAHIAESGYELSAPLANRFVHLDWDMPGAYWLDAMVAGFPAPKVRRLPNGWESKLALARGYVTGFGHARPAALQSMPQEASLRAGPWASYRTWTMAMRLVAASLAMGEKLDGNLALMLMKGCVGPGAAAEFLTWAVEMDLPDPEKVLADPSLLQMHDRGDRAYAVLSSVAAAVLGNNTIPRWTQGWEVLLRAAQQNRVDVAAMAARALASNQPANLVKMPKAIDAFIPVLQAAGMFSTR